LKQQVNLNSICVPSENVVARLIEDEMIIVPLVSGIGDTDDELCVLNETGQAIWQKLDGKNTINQICCQLFEEYDISHEELQKDIIGFVQELVSRGVIDLKS